MLLPVQQAQQQESWQRAIAGMLYPGVKQSDLSEEQKQTISTLATVSAGLAGGLTGNSTASAAVGAAAGMAWLVDGRYETISMAISSMIGDISGIICDGASNSCTMKVSTSASAAWKAVLMALDDTTVTGNEGIVAHDVEQSIANLCALANHSMQQTDRQIIEIMEKKSDKYFMSDTILKRRGHMYRSGELILTPFRASIGEAYERSQSDDGRFILLRRGDRQAGTGGWF